MLSFFQKESREGDSIKGVFSHFNRGSIYIVEGTVTKKSNSLIDINIKYPILISLEGIGKFIKLLLEEYDLDDSFTLDFHYTSIKVEINDKTENTIKATLSLKDNKYNIEISKK